VHKNDADGKADLGCQNPEIMLAFMMCLFPRMEIYDVFVFKNEFEEM